MISEDILEIIVRPVMFTRLVCALLVFCMRKFPEKSEKLGRFFLTVTSMEVNKKPSLSSAHIEIELGDYSSVSYPGHIATPLY